MLISQRRVSRLTFRAWGFPQNKWMNFGMCMFVCRRWSCAVGGNIVTRKTRIDKLNEKRSLIPLGLREPIWKMNLCSRLSELPSCKERPKTAICSKERIGRLKCLATGLDACLPFGHLVVFLFLKKWTLAEVCVKWSVILISRWVPKFSPCYEWKDRFCIVRERIW